MKIRMKAKKVTIVAKVYENYEEIQCTIPVQGRTNKKALEAEAIQMLHDEYGDHVKGIACVEVHDGTVNVAVTADVKNVEEIEGVGCDD